MKTLKPWLLLALVFCVGVVFGVAATRLVTRRVVAQVLLHPGLAIERHLTRKLRLDAGQQVKLAGILKDAHAQMQTVRQQLRPAAMLVFSNANQQIVQLLTPEQRLKYEKIKADNAPFLQGLQLAP